MNSSFNNTTRKLIYGLLLFIVQSYSTFLEDLQKDSDEDVDSGKTTGLELPFQENSHFKNSQSCTDS